jgi:DNA-binding response OmpR family regulator
MRTASDETSRLLLIEDDAALGESLSEALAASGYSVDWVDDGLSVRAAMLAAEHDLVVLDRRLHARARPALEASAEFAAAVLSLI